jgi:hypothetical protein
MGLTMPMGRGGSSARGGMCTRFPATSPRSIWTWLGPAHSHGDGSGGSPEDSTGIANFGYPAIRAEGRELGYYLHAN